MKTNSQAPKMPWVQDDPNYSLVNLLVQLVSDHNGNLWSNHDYLQPSDGDTASKLPTLGNYQIAFAFLTEAVRRETFISAFDLVLSEDVRGTNLIDQWVNGDESTRLEIEKRICERSQAHLLQNIMKLTPGCTKEILTMISSLPPRSQQ